MIDLACDQVIQGYLKELGSRFSCYPESGKLWLVSPFSYPDGDLIEISIARVPPDDVRISDLGETMRHLADLGFDPRASQTGEYLLGEITKQHGVLLDRGMIWKRLPLGEIGLAVQDVLAACLAIAHLVYLSRGFRPATFQEEVSHLLSEQRVKFEPHHVEVGRLSGKKYAIDFFVRGEKRDALIQALSASTIAASTGKVNATFRLWSDVTNGRWRTTLIDDRLFPWRPEDVRLLEGVSDVFPWSKQQDFVGMLPTIVPLEREFHELPRSPEG